MDNTYIVRRRFEFAGRVQGVGFRWRTKIAAEELDLTGWVKNEWDGSVIMEVQGPPEKIEKLITTLQNARYIKIRDIRMRELPVDPKEKQFRVGSSY
ncbi:MAG TPA: acylphosphatase [Lachnospiraceae bacterium]|nr:acylphosphatase [Lachnospiraceae bacterium]